jgi:hypothetical protein
MTRSDGNGTHWVRMTFYDASDLKFEIKISFGSRVWTQGWIWGKSDNKLRKRDISGTDGFYGPYDMKF